MALNPQVAFVLIGDTLPAVGFRLPNLRGLNMSFVEYRESIQRLVPLPLQWRLPCRGFDCGTSSGARRSNQNNKISDSRPLLGAAFESITNAYDWWAWMDIDVIFGHIDILPSAREVFCPLMPNGLPLSTWGAFTAFKREALLTSRNRARPANASKATGLRPYQLASRWRQALASPERQAFEETSIHCGGPSCGLGMSNALHPRHCQTAKPLVAEVNVCKDR